MPKFIIKLHDDKSGCDWYLEWSTIVDAPTSYGMSLEEFREYYQERYGTEGIRELPKRMESVEATGCSSRSYQDLPYLLNGNRAGDDETCLDMETIIDRYCRNRPSE